MRTSPWLFLLASAALAAPPEPPTTTTTTTSEPAGKGKAKEVVRLPLGPERPAEEGVEEKWDRPALQAPDTARKLVKGQPRREASGSAAPAAMGYLGGARLVAMSSGEARVIVAKEEQIVRVGDRLGQDRVRAVGDGVIVLDRPAVPGQPGGEATVVVRFDASGQPRVRIYHTEDPTPVEAPGVQ